MCLSHIIFGGLRAAVDFLLKLHKYPDRNYSGNQTQVAAKILYVSINTSKQFNYLVYMDLLTHDIQSLLVTLSLVTVLQMWWCVPH